MQVTKFNLFFTDNYKYNYLSLQIKFTLKVKKITAYYIIYMITV